MSCPETLLPNHKVGLFLFGLRASICWLGGGMPVQGLGVQGLGPWMPPNLMNSWGLSESGFFCSGVVSRCKGWGSRRPFSVAAVVIDPGGGRGMQSFGRIKTGKASKSAKGRPEGRF